MLGLKLVKIGDGLHPTVFGIRPCYNVLRCATAAAHCRTARTGSIMSLLSNRDYGQHDCDNNDDRQQSVLKMSQLFRSLYSGYNQAPKVHAHFVVLCYSRTSHWPDSIHQARIERKGSCCGAACLQSGRFVTRAAVTYRISWSQWPSVRSCFWPRDWL